MANVNGPRTRILRKIERNAPVPDACGRCGTTQEISPDPDFPHAFLCGECNDEMAVEARVRRCSCGMPASDGSAFCGIECAHDADAAAPSEAEVEAFIAKWDRDAKDDAWSYGDVPSVDDDCDVAS